MSEVPLKRARLRAYINTIADVVAEIEAGNSVSRDSVVKELKKALEEAQVEPFRGIRYSEEVYEKELISLYIVATRILRLPLRKFGKFFNEVFSNEICLDKVVTIIKKQSDSQKTRSVIETYLGTADEVTLSKIIRYITTEYYLDLIDEEEAVKSVGNLIRVYPEFSDKFSRMTKFFIAVVVSSKMVTNEIRSRMDLEMRKKALTINLGLSGGAPSNEYIVDIAKIAFGGSGNIKKLIEAIKTSTKRSLT